MPRGNSAAKNTMIRIVTSAGDDSAEFIAILMILAKSLEHVRHLPELDGDDALTLVLQVQRNLFGMVEELYPQPGQMERRVIAFADRMGFDIRQCHFSGQSNATH